MTGSLRCVKCEATYPILAGVAIVVPNVEEYLHSHVKGILAYVPPSEIPSEFREIEIPIEHQDDDLESERVNSLYVMTHYLSAKQMGKQGSPVLGSLIRKHWDKGPFSEIRNWMRSSSQKRRFSFVELGAGVGGLFPVLKPYLSSYLGIDSSFASIALARHFTLGAPIQKPVQIPGDLLQGPTSRPVQVQKPSKWVGNADFIVGDVAHPPLKEGEWDANASLNMIDMLETPEDLPALQFALLKKGGIAFQSSPYIWHEVVAKTLRESHPGIRDSAKLVERLYQQAGFQIQKRKKHVPWLFYKHLRQLEIYSVHMLKAKKP